MEPHANQSRPPLHARPAHHRRRKFALIMLERPDLVEKEVPLFIRQIRGSTHWPAFSITITE